MAGERKSGGSALGRLKARLKSEGSIGFVSKSAKRRMAKPKSEIEVVNPFEVKVNKQKHHVLGKQRQGDLGGLPGQSRLKAMEQREQTLLVEHKRKGRVSTFVDQRFGERDSNMTEEEKMVARFAKEREQRKRKSMFNLEDADDMDDDGEGLTHLGQSVNDIDDFSDMARADDDDDGGQTDASIVRRAHFGGFGDDEDHDEDGDDSGRPKTKREVMRELIAKSKMYKMERQAQRDEDAQLVERLDADFGMVRELLAPQLKQQPKQGGNDRKRRRDDDEDGDQDEYDALLREMAKERRAKPTDRLKTAEELARDEFLKLERLERERQRRMKGLDAEDASAEANDASGDSLGSNLAISRKDAFRNRKAIEYKDGKLIMSESEQQSLEEESRARRRARGRGGVGEDDSDDGGEGFDSEDGEDDDEDEEDGEEDDEEGDEDGEGDDDDEEDEEEEGDEDEEDEDEEGEEEEEHEKESKKRRRRVELLGVVSDDSDMEDDAPVRPSARSSSAVADPVADAARAAMIAAAQAEVPYIFKSMPETPAALAALLAGRSSEDALLIVTRLRAQYHISLGADNRRKQQALFASLLEHIETLGDAAAASVEGRSNYVLLENLLLPLRELAEVSQETGVQTVLARLRSIRRAVTEEETGAIRPLTPGEIAVARVLLFIYPTTDFRHAVLSPLLLLLGNVLAFAPALDAASHGRLLATALLVTDAHAATKRFAPEPLVAIKRILRDLFVLEKSPVFVPADSRVKPCAQGLVGVMGLGEGANASAAQRAALAAAAVEAVLAAGRMYATSLVALDALLSPFVALLEGREKKAAAELKQLCADAVAKRIPLQWQRHKAIAIKEYNPKFDVKYAPGRAQKDVNPERSETHKLKALVKKEKKGALRELRLDNAFMADVKRKEKKEKDDAYNSRIKSIHSMISTEQQSLSKEERIYAQRKKRK